MITTYIIFLISLWIHGCRSQCSKENPFYMIDKQCANFNSVCLRNNYDKCQSLLQACAQCPASNLTESALVDMLMILRDQRNTTTSHFDARLNNFSLEMKSQMNHQNETTEANYKKFEERLNKSEREILEKLALVEKKSIAICIFVVLLVILFVILLVLIQMRWQPFKLRRRTAEASSDKEGIPLITNPRFDETNHQKPENIENEIPTMPKTLSRIAAPSKQKNGYLPTNKFSKFYIVETNAPESIDFNIKSLRVIEICTREITIKSIFDHIKEVPLSYSNMDSIGNIKNKIADSLECLAKNVILFCDNKYLDDNILVFNIDIEQLKFCHLKQWVDSNKKDYLDRGYSSIMYTYKVSSLSEELVLKQYPWEPMKILKENEAILNELETFQITKSQEGFVRLNDVFTDKDSFYVSMEKMEGSIKDYIANNHPLSEEIIIKWAKQILSALKYLHSNGIIHRSIQSSSILLDKHENIKLSSFGLAKHARWEDKAYLKKEVPQSRVGTYRYMAPEHCSKDENCGIKSDIWSFGATMIEMATDKQPFDGMDEGKVTNYLGENKQIPFKLPETRSSKIKEFIDTCLKAKPHSRPTVDDLLQHDFLHE